MAFFACDEDDRIIHALLGQKGEIYHCLECFLPVKVRKSRLLSAHFYHIKASPKCRLYSKTEDHMLAQLHLQQLFPPGAIELERPFLNISRIADACWEEKKLIFEVQHSQMEIPEATKRMSDYLGQGYQVVWLLHDKLFNRKMVRPVEAFLRKHPTYYVQIQRGGRISFYDQFEVIAHGRRLKKGKKLAIDLKKPLFLKEKEWGPFCPKQIQDRATPNALYFLGDRLDQALHFPPLSLEQWRVMEIELAKKPKKPSRLKIWFRRYILDPYIRWIFRVSMKY